MRRASAMTKAIATNGGNSSMIVPADPAALKLGNRA